MYKIALYIRLSVEDKIKIEDSESIINQRLLLREYIINNKEFKGYEVEEYIDDGYSGTNVNRPGLQKLLDDVKKGIVKTIIVKDLSRFMRDYITLGDYLENIFPFLGVRFISINDGYDSSKEKGNGTDIDVQFKSLLYDFYSKDISDKVRTSTQALKQQGKFLGWSPPMGYLKDPNDKYNIIIDEKTAWIVKKVFKLALDGISTRKIATQLNEEKIPMPSVRKKELTNMDYEYNMVENNKNKKPSWTNGTIVDILMNENYTGTYVFNMVDNKVVGGRKYKFRPKDEWKRVYNHHEPIVSQEVFDKVQEIKESKRFIKGKNTDYEWYTKSPLQSFVKCYECNHIMSCSRTERKTKTKGVVIYVYFFCRICSLNKRGRNNSVAKGMEEYVLKKIKEKYTITNKSKKVSSKELNTKIENLRNKKIGYFEKYKLEKITKKKFINLKKEIDIEIEVLENQLTSVINSAESKLDEDTLTRDIMKKYIDHIVVKKSEVLDIVWKKGAI